MILFFYTQRDTYGQGEKIFLSKNAFLDDASNEI